MMIKLGESHISNKKREEVKKPSLLKTISAQSNAIYVNQGDEWAQKGGSGILFIIYKQSEDNEEDYQFKNELFMSRVRIFCCC